jgi:toluene monooxygenase system ferredoxin subunit
MAMRVRVCKLADVLEGEMRAFKVKGVTWPVLVMSAEGQLYATPGVCPHEDVALVDGYLFGTTVMCPAHSYQFDLRTGRCRHDPELELRRYPITIVGDEVWVDLM